MVVEGGFKNNFAGSSTGVKYCLLLEENKWRQLPAESFPHPVAKHSVSENSLEVFGRQTVSTVGLCTKSSFRWISAKSFLADATSKPEAAETEVHISFLLIWMIFDP